MALFSLGKRPKHRNFDYQARFYDKTKEDLENRMTPYSDDEKKNAALAKERIRGNFGRAGKIDSGYRRRSVKKSNFTLLITIVVLCVIGAGVIYKLAPTLMSFAN